MVVVLNHGKYYNKEAEYYRFRCSCGCDFVCSKWDLRQDDDSWSPDKDKKMIKCPDCKAKNFISTSGFLMPINGLKGSKVVLNSKLVETLTVDEYNMLTNPKEEDESSEDKKTE